MFIVTTFSRRTSFASSVPHLPHNHSGQLSCHKFFSYTSSFQCPGLFNETFKWEALGLNSPLRECSMPWIRQSIAGLLDVISYQKCWAVLMPIMIMSRSVKVVRLPIMNRSLNILFPTTAWQRFICPRRYGVIDHCQIIILDRLYLNLPAFSSWGTGTGTAWTTSMGTLRSHILAASIAMDLVVHTALQLKLDIKQRWSLGKAPQCAVHIKHAARDALTSPFPRIVSEESTIPLSFAKQFALVDLGRQPTIITLGAFIQKKNQSRGTSGFIRSINFLLVTIS